MSFLLAALLLLNKFREAKFMEVRQTLRRLARVLLGVLLMGFVAAFRVQAALEPQQDARAQMPNSLPADSGAKKLKSPPPVRISMEFKNTALKEVLKAFSKQTGLNVIASEDIGNRNITVYLEDVTALDALDRILEAGGLVYERSPGSEIYIVKPKPLVQEPPKAPAITIPTTVTRVYRLKFARISTSRLAKAVEALGSQTPFEGQRFLSMTETSSGGGGGSIGGTTSSSGASSAQVGIDKIIQGMLTAQGKLVGDERTNSLIVTDVPENFPRIEAILNALDVRTAQILIEAELLETSLAKLKNLGIKWGSATDGTLGTLTPATRTTRFPYSIFGDKSGSATSVSLGTINTSQSAAILQALERDTNTKVLAQPKVLTLDNESAVIRLTTQQAIGFTTTTGQQTATTSATPERTTTGVILVVTPQVNDGGFVTMLVEPSVTKTVTAQIQPPTIVGGTVVDPKTRSARSLVRIRQGETLVLGGLIDRSDQESFQQVPILSGIPVVGEAFKSKGTDAIASELIVFLTPRILAESTDLGATGTAPFPVREQETNSSRQDTIDTTLKRLEGSPL